MVVIAEASVSLSVHGFCSSPTQVAPVTAQVETTHCITFSLGVGSEHSLKFTPREHKDELSLRYIALPTVTLTGDVRTSRKAKLPRVSLELVVKQMNIDLTTDVLNQLLILQNSFIKVRTFG